MKNLLTNAFQAQYFDELRDKHVGFNGNYIRYMLTYLHERFGEALPLDLDEEEK